MMLTSRDVSDVHTSKLCDFSWHQHILCVTYTQLPVVVETPCIVLINILLLYLDEGMISTSVDIDDRFSTQSLWIQALRYVVTSIRFPTQHLCILITPTVHPLIHQYNGVIIPTQQLIDGFIEDFFSYSSRFLMR